MRIRTARHGIVEIAANLGAIPVFKLLRYRSPWLRIEAIVGKRHFVVPLQEFEFENDADLRSLNADVLPFLTDTHSNPQKELHVNAVTGEDAHKFQEPKTEIWTGEDACNLASKVTR